MSRKKRRRAKVILAAEAVQAQKERAIAERKREIARLNQESDLDLEGAQVKRDIESLLEKAAGPAQP